MKSKLEIIDETVAFYSKDPENLRATNKTGNCFYLIKPKDEKHLKCAVGRCIDKKYIDKLDYKVMQLQNLTHYLDENKLDDILMPEYRGHDINFWYDLQDLHDINNYWDFKNDGLSESGIKEVSRLKEKYAKG